MQHICSNFVFFYGCQVPSLSSFPCARLGQAVQMLAARKCPSTGQRWPRKNPLRQPMRWSDAEREQTRKQGWYQTLGLGLSMVMVNWDEPLLYRGSLNSLFFMKTQKVYSITGMPRPPCFNCGCYGTASPTYEEFTFTELC